MIERPLILDQPIMNCLKVDYGIQVTTLVFLPLGADMNASIYKAQAVDLTSYFVKLKRGHHHDIGVEIVQLLHDAGTEQIIPPIRTIHGRSTQRIEDFTLVVYPFIEGKDGFSRDLTDTQWIKLGKTLRQIHEIELPLSIQHEIRREEYSPKWREIVRSLYSYIEAEPRGDDIALKLWKFMKEHMVEIRHLVDCADQLAQKLSDV